MAPSAAEMVDLRWWHQHVSIVHAASIMAWVREEPRVSDRRFIRANIEHIYVSVSSEILSHLRSQIVAMPDNFVS